MSRDSGSRAERQDRNGLGPEDGRTAPEEGHRPTSGATQEIINRLKELLTKATEGPWEVQPRTFSTTFFLVRRDRTTDEHCIADVTRREDADAIAAVFNLLSTLTNLTPSGVEREASGETVLGFRVAAYRETHPEHGDTYGHRYSEHWSTPTRNPAVKVERLFTEDQLRAALALPSEPPSQGDVE